MASLLSPTDSAPQHPASASGEKPIEVTPEIVANQLKRGWYLVLPGTYKIQAEDRPDLNTVYTGIRGRLNKLKDLEDPATLLQLMKAHLAKSDRAVQRMRIIGEPGTLKYTIGLINSGFTLKCRYIQLKVGYKDLDLCLDAMAKKIEPSVRHSLSLQRVIFSDVPASAQLPQRVEKGSKEEASTREAIKTLLQQKLPQGHTVEFDWKGTLKVLAHGRLAMHASKGIKLSVLTCEDKKT